MCRRLARRDAVSRLIGRESLPMSEARCGARNHLPRAILVGAALTVAAALLAGLLAGTPTAAVEGLVNALAFCLWGAVAFLVCRWVVRLSPEGLARLEAQVLGIAAALLLISWIGACLGRSGSWFGRLLPPVLALGLGLLERRCPWRGFQLYLLCWPCVKGLSAFAKEGSPTLSFSTDWMGPAVGVLSVVYWMRLRRAQASDGDAAQEAPASVTNSAAGTGGWLQAFRWALWILVLSCLMAGLCGSLRLFFGPSGWGAGARVSAPLTAADDVLPPLVLGLLLLNGLWPRRADSALRAPFRPLAWALVLGGVACGVWVLVQRLAGVNWPYVDTQPFSGPFSNRNTAAPVLMLLAVLALVLFRKPRWEACASLLSGGFLGVMALATGSRAGALIAAALPILLLFWKASGLRAFVALVLMAALAAAALWVPLPEPSALAADSLQQRAVDALQGLRKGDLNRATGNRWELQAAAWAAWKEYPLTGTGPDSYRFLIRPPARFGRHFANPENQRQRWCHCTPLQLLVENGIPGGLAWAAAWLVLPFLALMRWRTANGLALTALLCGLANLVDCSWPVPGLTFAMVAVLVWGLGEESANAADRKLAA